MDNPRLFLWIGLALLAWMNIIQWDRDFGAAVRCEHRDDGVERDVARRGTRSAGRGLVEPACAAVSHCAGRGSSRRRNAGAGDQLQSLPLRAPSIRVVTDVIDMDISLQGGDLLRADLLQYPRDKKPGSPAVRLLSTDDATYGVVRSGLRAADGRAEPTHLALYTAPATRIPSRAGRAGTARAVDVDGRAGRHRHEDLRLQAGPVRRRSDL